ncbi:hypothetical protein M2404_003842 [Rheinheimera pacifica]|uniref:hypothetical protein n=1 Tax=Rheinheimera pacifica TaxID=173990 RepID=UPI002166E27E|nr:hypothetical protein [Rheinheimera pacifica]MCS4309470.1 hypothetical protein [Rheinheimera pacifica]
MKIYINHINVAKSAAKRLRTICGSGLELARYHDTVAKMLGYQNYFELTQTTKKQKHEASALDECLTIGEQEQRLLFQALQLQTEMNFDRVESLKVALELRLTAGDKKSPTLLYPDYDKNHFVSVKADDGYIDIFLLNSSRSRKRSEYLLEILAEEPEQDNYYEFLEVFHQQPENIRSIAYLLEQLVAEKERESGYAMATSLVLLVRDLINELPTTGKLRFSYTPYEHRMLFSAIALAKSVFDYLQVTGGAAELAMAYQTLSMLVGKESEYHIQALDA